MNVYVVTFSDKGEERGEFWTEEAFTRMDETIVSAGLCMAKLRNSGNFRTFLMDTKRENMPHVVYSWSSDKHTVWIERLRLRGSE